MAQSKFAKIQLFRVVGRFPGQSAKMQRLYLHSPDFRALCDDFLLALDTLERFERESEARHHAEIVEYTHLIPELEIEIAIRLSRMDAGGTAEV